MANRQLSDGYTAAVSLIGRAVSHDEPGVHTLADEIARGDNTREALAVLAVLAKGLLETVAVLRHEPVDKIFDDLSGAAARDINLLDDEEG